MYFPYTYNASVHTYFGVNIFDNLYSDVIQVSQLRCSICCTHFGTRTGLVPLSGYWILELLWVEYNLSPRRQGRKGYIKFN